MARIVMKKELIYYRFSIKQVSIGKTNVCLWFTVRKPSYNKAVADPGFPVGGHAPIRGAWTSNVGTFWQKCMQK